MGYSYFMHSSDHKWQLQAFCSDAGPIFHSPTLGKAYRYTLSSYLSIFSQAIWDTLMKNECSELHTPSSFDNFQSYSVTCILYISTPQTRQWKFLQGLTERSQPSSNRVYMSSDESLRFRVLPFGVKLTKIPDLLEKCMYNDKRQIGIWKFIYN